ncbi:MAG: hypothetical protein ACJ8FF_09200 [Sphingomicrobium sp.]
MGPQEMTVGIATQGDSFTGKAQSPMGDMDFAGQAAGDNLTWSADITKPMPLTLEFDANVDGDRMTGTVKLGAFGNAPLNGVRI